MAKARAVCTCIHCGVTFEKTNKCYNRTAADSWETWASKYFDLCPECYAKAEAERLMQGEVVEMHYSEYKNKYADKRTIYNSYNPTTKTILVVIKTVEELAKEKELMQRRAAVSKSEIFSYVHRLAKALSAENPEKTYHECLSICLKKVYTVVREAKEYLVA